MGMHVVLSGNPIDGFSVIGPFKTFEDALAYCEGLDGDWWITPLVAQETT